MGFGSTTNLLAERASKQNLVVWQALSPHRHDTEVLNQRNLHPCLRYRAFVSPTPFAEEMFAICCTSKHAPLSCTFRHPSCTCHGGLPPCSVGAAPNPARDPWLGHRWSPQQLSPARPCWRNLLPPHSKISPSLGAAPVMLWHDWPQPHVMSWKQEYDKKRALAPQLVCARSLMLRSCR